MGTTPNDMSLRTEDLDYELDPALIATEPASVRTDAKLLVVHPDHVEHRLVRDLPEYLQPGDLVARNTTTVIPARLVGTRSDTGGSIEGIFIEQRDPSTAVVMLKPSRRLRGGLQVVLQGPAPREATATLNIRERRGDAWIVDFDGADVTATMHACGWTPLPGYIRSRRATSPAPAMTDHDDRSRYQTVYASESVPSIAAPTAGLHLDEALLGRIRDSGVRIADVQLAVGVGTFAPIKSEFLGDHDMHREYYSVQPTDLESLAAHDHGSSKLLAVGTTTVRVLESLPESPDPAHPCSGWTDLFITPPYRFKRVDALLTNFHLPRSSLIALVGALVGLDRLKQLYAEAASLGYRFYSYGDAMLVMPGCSD